MATSKVDIDFTDDQLTVTMQEGEVANGLDLATPSQKLFQDGFPTKDKDKTTKHHVHLPHLPHILHKDSKKAETSKSKESASTDEKTAQSTTTSNNASLTNGKSKPSSRFTVNRTNTSQLLEFDAKSTKGATADSKKDKHCKSEDPSIPKHALAGGMNLLSKGATTILTPIPLSQAVVSHSKPPQKVPDTAIVPQQDSCVNKAQYSQPDVGQSPGAADPSAAPAAASITSVDEANDPTTPKPDNSDQKDVEMESLADCADKKKRVSFPDGQALIKGFALAPNPWYNVSLCTTDNLVIAYTDSCRIHGVRPIPKLISQLKVIKDFGERINLLTLKGESLNARHIETLEEVFRRVQFNTIDMEATHLDDEAAISLFEMVEYYESAIHLKVAQNKNLGTRAWLACARMIRKTPCMESLDVRGCSLNEQCIAVLGRALRMGAFVSVLHMQDCNLACRGIMIMSAALRTISTVKELHIGENNLQPSDGIQLGNLIRNNIFLHTLDIRNNHLQDVGVSHICDGLADQPNGLGLRTLILSNNHITYHSMAALACALSKTRSLTSLNLSHNNLTNEGVYVLKDGLLKNKSLTRLSLRATKISCEGTVALAEFIADSFTVSQLDLRDNDIKTAGLLALSMCVRVHQTVTRLELDQSVKKEQAVKDYQSQQKFFLDEIQTQVQANAELARSNLEKLLDRSTFQHTSRGAGAEAVVDSDEAVPAAAAEALPGQTAAVTPSDLHCPSPMISAENERNKEEDGDSNKYFDPLGAVTIETDSTTDGNSDGQQVDGSDAATAGGLPKIGNGSPPRNLNEIHRGDSIELASEIATSVLAFPVLGPAALEIQASMKQQKECDVASADAVEVMDCSDTSPQLMVNDHTVASTTAVAGMNMETETEMPDLVSAGKGDEENVGEQLTLSEQQPDNQESNTDATAGCCGELTLRDELTDEESRSTSTSEDIFNSSSSTKESAELQTADVGELQSPERSHDLTSAGIDENVSAVVISPPTLISLASSAVGQAAEQVHTESMMVEVSSNDLEDFGLTAEEVHLIDEGIAMTIPPTLVSLASAVVSNATDHDHLSDSLQVGTSSTCVGQDKRSEPEGAVSTEEGDLMDEGVAMNLPPTSVSLASAVVSNATDCDHSSDSLKLNILSTLVGLEERAEPASDASAATDSQLSENPSSQFADASSSQTLSASENSLLPSAAQSDVNSNDSHPAAESAVPSLKYLAQLHIGEES